MAEVEYKGIKIGGSKLLLLLPLIGTLGSIVWGGMEAYTRWQKMEAKIEKFVSPDLSGFDKRLAVQSKTVDEVRKEMKSVRLRVAEIQQLTRGLHDDVRSDTAKTYKAISAVDRRSRSADADTRAAMRQAEKLIRSIIAASSDRLDAKVNSAASTFDAKTSSAVTRFDAKINGIDTKLNVFERRQDKKLRDALNNPLLK